MGVELAAAPANQEPERKHNNQNPDRDLRTALDLVRQMPAEEHHRQAETEERRSVTNAPRQPESRRASCAVARVGQHQRRNGSEVIRIRRVPQPEKKGEDERHHHPSIGQLSDLVVEAKHADQLSPSASVAAATAA
jgi:hypothetical protein